MLKTLRTKWYNGDYYLLKEEGKFFKLYVNSVYKGETRDFLHYDEILPFNVNDMKIEFVNSFEFVKNL